MCEPTLFILLALSKERKHGYAILRDVEVLSEGRVVLSTGTLYGALARLLDQGVIRKSADDGKGQDICEDTEIDEDDAPKGTRERKYYQLTRFGQRVLEAEVGRLGAILAAANRELGREGSRHDGAHDHLPVLLSA